MVMQGTQRWLEWSRGLLSESCKKKNKHHLLCSKLDPAKFFIILFVAAAYAITDTCM